MNKGRVAYNARQRAIESSEAKERKAAEKRLARLEAKISKKSYKRKRDSSKKKKK